MDATSLAVSQLRACFIATTNPDCAALARAYGGHGEVVERTADAAAAFRRAEEAPSFALLDLRVDPETVTPRHSISEIRAGALAGS